MIRKKYHNIKGYLLMICCLCFVTCSLAANRHIDPEKWHELTSGKSFSYKNEVEALPKPTAYKPGIFEKLLEWVFKLVSSKAGMVMLWILVAVAILLILYRLYTERGSLFFSKQKKVLPTLNVSTIEDLASTNWEHLLQQAMSQQDIKSAVRCYYMWMLQMLQNSNLIRYRIDKTNFEYFCELADNPIKQPFRKLSSQYEYTWYGEYPLTDAGFRGFQELFITIRHQVEGS